LTELKQSLIQYAQQNNLREIMERSSQLLADDRSVYTDLNTILLYLKGEKDE